MIVMKNSNKGSNGRRPKFFFLHVKEVGSTILKQNQKTLEIKKKDEKKKQNGTRKCNCLFFKKKNDRK